MTRSRKRTLDHMQRLLAAAALTGACKPPWASSDSGTTTGYGVVDPMPPPALDAGVITPPSLPEAGSPKPEAGSKEAGKTVLTMPTIEIHEKTAPTVTAYGVVDPLPPPTLYKK